MSHNYYYFISSLPHLNYGDKPPISSEEFREQCYNFLSKQDAAFIKYCCYNAKLAVQTVERTGSAFIDLLMLRERIASLTLANLRAAEYKRPPVGDVPQDVPRAEANAKAVYAIDDPLEAELAMDRARWGVLDEMVGTNYFGVNTVFAYLLKLQLLERKRRFDAQKGAANYRELYNLILNEYNSKV